MKRKYYDIMFTGGQKNYAIWFPFRTATFATLLAFAMPSSANSDDAAATCFYRVRRVVEGNYPHLMTLPQNGDMIGNGGNSRVGLNKLHIKVSWSHVDDLIAASGDKWCVGSYLIEYGPERRVQAKKRRNRRVPRRHGHVFRRKREIVGSSAFVSSTLGRDNVSYVLVLDIDNCEVYSVHLLVIPAVVIARPMNQHRRLQQRSGDHDDNLISSGKRKFWPAAYRTVLDVFSDAAVISWMPACSYATDGWHLEACPEVNDGGDRLGCVVSALTGKSPVHISGLRPCNFYKFKLMSYNHEDHDGHLLWTFATARTLPVPQVEIVTGKTWLKLVITQNGGDCNDDEALIHHWRVTFCNKDETDAQLYKTIQREGSGDDSSKGDDDNFFDYYDEVQHSSSSSCVSKLYDAKKKKCEIILNDLDRCVLYSVEVSPTDVDGRAIQPGEQYESVHSTLCDDDDENSFWFSKVDPNSGEISGFNRGSERGSRIGDNGKTSDEEMSPHLSGGVYLVLACGGFSVILGIIALTLGALRHHPPTNLPHSIRIRRYRGSAVGGEQLKCREMSFAAADSSSVACSPEEEASPKRALLRGQHST